jgi:hypothetical protein
MVGFPMKTYARIRDGFVVELLPTDGDISNMFNPALVWLDVSSQSGIAEGWSFDGEKFAPPVMPPSPVSLPTVAELQARITALSAQLAALSDHD